MRRVISTIALLISALVSAASARPLYGVATTPDLTPTNLYSLSIPVMPPPPIVATDYDAYRQDGTATVKVPFYVPFKSGQQMLCDPHDDNAYLYPNTPFVAWILQKYLTDIRDRRPYAFPGATIKNIPDYLWTLGRDPRKAYRSSSSCLNGYVFFSNVPAGSYIFIGEMNDYDHAADERSDIGYGILGIPYYKGSHIVDASTYHGTWYTGMVPFTVKAGETIEVPVKGAHTFTFAPKR